MTKSSLKGFVPLRNQSVFLFDYYSTVFVLGMENVIYSPSVSFYLKQSVTLFGLMTIMMIGDLVGTCSRLYIALNI